ncbi:MAG TPA: PqqD family protein [Sphingomicrobium sp.]
MEADIGNELVALDPEAGNCFGFNEVATSVWRSLEQPKTFDELRDELLREYDVGSEQCSRELQMLLEDLISRRLVEKTEAAGNNL